MLEAILVIVFYALVAYLCQLLLTVVSYKPVVRYTIEAPARLVVPKPALVPPTPMVVTKIKQKKFEPADGIPDSWRKGSRFHEEVDFYRELRFILDYKAKNID
eukprot:TRINITY_DN5412_c0_g1_i1.p1 TRINITY_DN5412_c0_g1~~TRINITY_DN5412_c0_g1_i1.p1  ORF type:complete len:103 (+),score=5.80 TRINITY_DN5412_c0_g1_i1:119-427(+)